MLWVVTMPGSESKLTSPCEVVTVVTIAASKSFLVMELVRQNCETEQDVEVLRNAFL